MSKCKEHIYIEIVRDKSDFFGCVHCDKKFRLTEITYELWKAQRKIEEMEHKNSFIYVHKLSEKNRELERDNGRMRKALDKATEELGCSVNSLIREVMKNA